jgi:hypothetical protein
MPGALGLTVALETTDWVGDTAEPHSAFGGARLPRASLGSPFIHSLGCRR